MPDTCNFLAKGVPTQIRQRVNNFYEANGHQ
jgi:hypothetical protein